MAHTVTTMAALTEVFSSVQGEGPYAGVRQLFVRFYGCHRRCAFCDSPETVTAWQRPGFQPETFRVEFPAGSGRFEVVPNPVDVEDLVALADRFDVPRGLHHSIALTGGEPLLHAPYLAALLPALRARGWKTYLETAGDLFLELDHVIAHVDIVAMDLKLPSVTRNEASWGHHRKFLERCRDAGVGTFAKVIVSGSTTEADLAEAVRIVAETAPAIPFVLQPVTPFRDVRDAAQPGQLLRWQAMAAERLRDVRVIPQCHKMMNQL
jgi:organic radical activating enzyme